MVEKAFSKLELQKFDGDHYPRIYVAFRGVVYDVTDCPKWKTGLHEGMHFPGQDLTCELEKNAPHADEVFHHQCVKKVGIMIGQDD